MANNNQEYVRDKIDDYDKKIKDHMSKTYYDKLEIENKIKELKEKHITPLKSKILAIMSGISLLYILIQIYLTGN